MIKYFIDRVDISTTGVWVKRTHGLFNLPKLKNPLTISWPNRHGVIVDLSNPIYDSREIVLECYMRASSRIDFLATLNAFITNHILKPNLRELMVEVVSGKPLLYYCYMPNGLDLDMVTRWNDSTHIGEFKLNLNEPEPFKRVYRFTAAKQARELAFSFSSSQQFTVYWGDGCYDKVVTGTTVSHHYQGNGTYYIALVGMVNDIQNLQSQPEVDLVWNLQ